MSLGQSTPNTHLTASKKHIQIMPWICLFCCGKQFIHKGELSSFNILFNVVFKPDLFRPDGIPELVEHPSPVLGDRGFEPYGFEP